MAGQLLYTHTHTCAASSAIFENKAKRKLNILPAIVSSKKTATHAVYAIVIALEAAEATVSS